MKEVEEEKTKAEEERTILEDDIEMREIYPDTSFEIDIPGSVIATLNVHPEKGKVRFVEENGRVYIEKAQSEEIKADEKTIVLDKEKKIASGEDYYTRHERRIKEEFEPGSVSIEKIDQDWNIELPDNIHQALGLIEGDHVRFEAVDRETFKISKIR